MSAAKGNRRNPAKGAVRMNGERIRLCDRPELVRRAAEWFHEKWEVQMCIRDSFQATLNTFGALDVLPFTGVTLPFISRGGSSMISSFALLAFIKTLSPSLYSKRRRVAHENDL